MNKQEIEAELLNLAGREFEQIEESVDFSSAYLIAERFFADQMYVEVDEQDLIDVVFKIKGFE